MALARCRIRFCGIGRVLYISNAYFFRFKACFGRGSNKYSKLVTLWSLLKLDIVKKLVSLWVFGDPMFKAKWMNNEKNAHSISLLPLASHIKEIARHITNLSINDIDRELNLENLTIYQRKACSYNLPIHSF